MVQYQSPLTTYGCMELIAGQYAQLCVCYVATWRDWQGATIISASRTRLVC